MRTVLKPVLLAAMVTMGVTPALAAPQICISTRDISDSKPDDEGKTILFTMKNGTKWRNTLQGRCPGLKYDGFAWRVRGANSEVCENTQTLHVLGGVGESCTLGKFEKMSTPPPRG